MSGLDSDLREIDTEELKRHTKLNDCWIAIHGNVYDITGFMDEHPGGTDILRLHAGEDATREFDDVGHSSSASKQLKFLVVGRLKK